MLGEHAQRDQQRAGLVDAQPQRPGDGLGVVDEDLAAVPGHVDQVAGGVAGQPAHPHQLQVVDELLLAQPEHLRHLGDLGARVRHQVGHQREQPGQPVGGVDSRQRSLQAADHGLAGVRRPDHLGVGGEARRPSRPAARGR